MEYTAELRDYEIIHIDDDVSYATGCIFNDKKGRFPDGSHIGTSEILERIGDMIITHNSTYKLIEDEAFKSTPKLELVASVDPMPVDKTFIVDVVTKVVGDDAEIKHYAVKALNKRAAAASAMANLNPTDAIHLIGISSIMEATSIGG